MSIEEGKRIAAEKAAEMIPSGCVVVGLGTGSTAKYFIEAVGRLVAEGREISAVPTSEASRQLAASLSIPLLSDDGPWAIDICVDGADEVSADLQLIKGGGGAQTREKIVNQASKLNVIVVDDSKISKKLGETWKVPLEILPFAYRATLAQLEAFGGAVIRQKDGKNWVTDSGNWIADLNAGVIAEPKALEASLKAIPGIVETGLFVGRCDAVIIASADGQVRIEHRNEAVSS